MWHPTWPSCAAAAKCAARSTSGLLRYRLPVTSTPYSCTGSCSHHHAGEKIIPSHMPPAAHMLPVPCTGVAWSIQVIYSKQRQHISTGGIREQHGAVAVQGARGVHATELASTCAARSRSCFGASRCSQRSQAYLATGSMDAPTLALSMPAMLYHTSVLPACDRGPCATACTCTGLLRHFCSRKELHAHATCTALANTIC